MRKVRIGAAVLVCCLAMSITCLAEYDSTTIQQVQQALNDAGFDCGAPDGMAGKNTAAAVSAYQEANGLAVDGQINDELLVSLGLKEGEAEPESETEEAADAQAPAAENEAEAGAGDPAKAPAEAGDRIDYLILVNEENSIPDDWEENLVLGTTTDIVGREVQLEAETLEQYLKMRQWLLDEEDWDIEILEMGCYFSIEDYERAYANIVEVADEERAQELFGLGISGRSENSTGLVIDIGFMIDGNPQVDKEFLLTSNLYKKVHPVLADYGFIIRYPEGKEDITGHSYEPWHIRYVGSPEVAHEITDQGLTLEEYLAK